MIYNVEGVRRLSTKFQFDTCKTKEDKICACAVVHLVVEIQAMIYDAARGRRLCTKFQVNTSKNKNFHFGGRGGGLDCVQYQTLTDPRNCLKNQCTHFGHDRSHRLGGV